MGVGKSSTKGKNAQRRKWLRRRLRVERLTDRRVLAAMTGMVFEDANLSFQQDAEEAGLGGRLLYLDINQNAAIDAGEPFALGAEDGSFSFENLADGDYALRLYNGTDSQEQTFPIEAVNAEEVVPISGGISALVSGNLTLALTDQTVEVADFETGESQSISVGTNLTAMQPLPDGNVIVIGGESDGETAWLVDPSAGTSTAIDLGGGTVVWSQIAIDGEGYGIAIGSVDDVVEVRAIKAADSGAISSSSVYETVPADAQAITSATGGRSVLAWSGENGPEVALWSNSTGTLIRGEQVDDWAGLEAFDDASGLLVMRSEAGGVTVHDANGDISDGSFARLWTLPDVTGPVALDASRELLLTVTPDSSLQLYNVNDGNMIADVAIDLDGVGTVADLQYDGDQRSLVVLGNEGVAQVLLEAGAHRFTVTGGEDPDPIAIGVRLDGDNSPPSHDTPPKFETLEDESLIRAAPGVRIGASDPDGDEFVVLRTAPPANGTAIVYPNGSLVYTPRPDFFGTDVFTVLTHDGRDHANAVSVQVDVLPLPDPPSGITVNPAPVPENAVPGHIVGPIVVNDVDLNDNHNIQLNDGRFIVKNGQIIFIDGELNFELEPVIGIQVYVEFPEDPGYLIENIFIEVTDENDPITAIGPDEAEVHENDPGASVALLTAEDEDVDSEATFTVDDDRFVIVDDSLTLAEGVALDYEAEPIVTVNITANDGELSHTEELEIRVLDVPEEVLSIELTNHSVLELSPGEVVGQVIVNGQLPQDAYDLQVSDPRFEIVGGTLKLIDGQWVERAVQEEIQLTVIAQDIQGVFDPASQAFVIEVIENETPYHNDDSPFDVDGNGILTAADALAIINYLNIYGPGPVGFGDPGYGYDVNGDGLVTALDALLILNELNRIQMLVGGGTVGGEPEGEEVQPEEAALNQPQHIAPQQSGDLILPQHIASADDEDERLLTFPASPDRDLHDAFYDAADFAANHSSEDQAVVSSESDHASDEASRRVDEALESVIRNNTIG